MKHACPEDVKVVPETVATATEADEQRAVPSSGHRYCAVCGERRAQGHRLVAIRGKSSLWVCNDCQRMLLLRVVDNGTPGD